MTDSEKIAMLERENALLREHIELLRRFVPTLPAPFIPASQPWIDPHVAPLHPPSWQPPGGFIPYTPPTTGLPPLDYVTGDSFPN